MKSNIMLLLMFPIVAFYSCNKKQPPTPVSQIIDYCPEKYIANSSPIPSNIYIGNQMPSAPAQPDYRYMSDYVYFEVTNNPNNPFEILFVRCPVVNMEYDANQRELCLYNFCENKLTILDDVDALHRGIDWGSNNWIIYSLGQSVYKIRPNGTNKTELLTSNFYRTEINWSPSGTKFMISLTNVIKTYNEFGNEINTISIDHNSCTWKNDDEIIYSNNGGVSVYNLDTQNTALLLNNNYPGANHLSYYNNSLVFSDNNGIHEYKDGVVTTLISNFHTFFGSSPTYLTENEIIFNRMIADTNEYHLNNLNMSYYLSIYSRNTNEERIINLPE